MNYKSAAILCIGSAAIWLAMRQNKPPIENAKTDMDVASILASGKPAYPLPVDKMEETIYERMAKGAARQGYYFI